MRLLRFAFMLFVVTAFSACIHRSDDKIRGRYGDTLADLKDEEVPAEVLPVPVPTMDQVEQSYRAALEVAQEPEIRHRILVRLADIEMARSENRQLESNEQKEYFTDAIAMYKELIDLNKGKAQSDVNNERLLYQLSKAYALDGKIEESNDVLSKLVTNFPDSAYSAEADFRQADLAFRDKQYAKAEELYTKVMAAGSDTPFYTNAVYMQGWARFKRNHYDEAIESFTQVLDRSIEPGKDLDDLPPSKKNLAKDTLRIMSIVFSYLDGSKTIDETYARLGKRPYQYMLYANLGELYFEKERYKDSADTYLAYVEQFPESDQAPAFSVKAIDVYSKGDFPSLILPAKEGFIKHYGVYSNFWKVRSEEQREKLRPFLKPYLIELSSYYHAEAQTLDKAKAEYEKQLAAGKKPKEKPEASTKNYLRAAELYGEFVLTFASDPQTPEMTFLQGEAYYAADHLPEAVQSYETVAYQYVDTKRGPDAGYNAILALEELIRRTDDKKAQAEANKQWREHKTNSAISYSDYYATDPRAVAVLTQAAQDLYAGGQVARASTIAERLTKWQPQQSRDLQITAWLLLGHTKFDLEQYADAEWAYRHVLGMLDSKDARRQQVTDRISASMYRQAEFQVKSGDEKGAVERLLSIAEFAPGSEIAASSEYDAATHLIDMKDWKRAEQVLLDFKRRYPNHKLAGTLDTKFAYIYQESEQWGKAAVVLGDMANSGDPEVRRQSLYMSAELYAKSGNNARAIDQYRDYANKYPEPFDLATEARFHLQEMYGKAGEPAKRDYWLHQLIDADARAGNKRSDRSRYLAAMAASKFADDDYSHFVSVKLKNPIKKSMKAKKSALETTLAAYKKVVAYGVADYVTQANHRIASLYSQLSKDLMASERPKGMNDATSEQYEMLLEEQAYPFEEKAISLFKVNTERTKDGIYDNWVKASFKELARLLPAQYGKKESVVEFSNELQ